MTTLITGGTGKTGRRVAQRLTATGRTVRLGSRSGDVRFDWDDELTWAPALDGCRSAYVTFAPDLAFPGAADTVAAFAKTAVDAGTTRLVLLSGRGEPGAQLAEQRLIESGADWTVVRCAFFAQNFSETFWADSVRAGELVLPGNALEPIVDLEDVADVAAAALTDDRHIGQVYECTGPRLLGFDDAMAEISRATDRLVAFRAVTPEDFAAGLVDAGLPAADAEGLAALFVGILDGHNSSLNDGVDRALGRAPRDFTEYVRRTAGTGAWHV
ncbi:MAG: NmrA family transcriptional regulator [Nocardioides sp.]